MSSLLIIWMVGDVGFIPSCRACSGLYHKTVIISEPEFFMKAVSSIDTGRCQKLSSPLLAGVTSSSRTSVLLIRTSRRQTDSHGGPFFIVVLNRMGNLSRLSHLARPFSRAGSDDRGSDLGRASHIRFCRRELIDAIPPCSSTFRMLVSLSNISSITSLYSTRASCSRCFVSPRSKAYFQKLVLLTCLAPDAPLSVSVFVSNFSPFASSELKSLADSELFLVLSVPWNRRLSPLDSGVVEGMNSYSARHFACIVILCPV